MPPDTAAPVPPPPPPRPDEHLIGVMEKPRATAVRGTVHGCPVFGSGQTTCCERTPFELPRNDRLTIDPKQVTCGE